MSYIFEHNLTNICYGLICIKQRNILKKSKHMKSRIVREGKQKRNTNDKAGNIEKMLPARLVMTLIK